MKLINEIQVSHLTCTDRYVAVSFILGQNDVLCLMLVLNDDSTIVSLVLTLRLLAHRSVFLCQDSVSLFAACCRTLMRTFRSCMT